MDHITDIYELAISNQEEAHEMLWQTFCNDHLQNSFNV